MIQRNHIEQRSPQSWVSMDGTGEAPDIESRCDIHSLNEAIQDLDGITVAASSVNRSGVYTPEADTWSFLPGMEPSPVPNLPDFCDVTVHVEGPGGHVAHVRVWVPLVWNGRFLGTAGGGNRTSSPLGFFPETVPVLLMPVAIRNGFATASTDGGNRSNEGSRWGLDPESRELDDELIENLAHRSTHDMTVIGKRITQAIHGEVPTFSYLGGASGGGRQTLVEAQRYPEDYDGLLALAPGINWTRMLPAMMWAPVVMNNAGTVLSPAKFAAFQAAVLDACDGRDGVTDGFLGAFDPVNFDPRSIVGSNTEDGQITEADADVMSKIWEGPRSRSGEFLWYGLRPGAQSWMGPFGPIGNCVTQKVGDEWVPIPFSLAEDYVGLWVLKDPNWDWKTMTLDDYEAMFAHNIQTMEIMESADPDLNAFRQAGGKLIIAHGANDEVIPFQGSVDYYHRVVEAVGGEDTARSFVRLFITDGGEHVDCLGPGPGLSPAASLGALMRWVENGEAPDQIIAEKVDPFTGTVTATRPVFAYPSTVRYSGSGDPQQHTSYVESQAPDPVEV